MANNQGQKPDDLLQCLVFLTGFYGRSKSADSLKSGLPQDEGGFSLTRFIQAADREGINIRKKGDLSLKDIANETLPCVLILKGGRACVLLAKSDQAATIWNPDAKAQQKVPLADVQKNMDGTVILVRPKSEFVDRQLSFSEDKKNLGWFWNVVRENRSIYTKVLLASLLINIFAVVSPVYIMNVYNRVIPNNAVETGWALAIGVLLVYAFDFIIRTLRGYFTDFSGRNIDVQVTRKLYDRVLDMKIANRPTSSGAFANMLREFDSVRDFLTSATLVTLVDLPFAIIFILVIFILGGAMGAAVLLLMVASLVASMMIQIPLSRHVRKSMHSAETKHGLLVETIYGLENIKMTGGDGRLRARYAAHVAENANESMKSRHYSALSVNISTLIQQIASVVIIVWGTYMIRDLDMQMGALIACVMLSGRALSPVTQVANLMSRYHQSRSSLRILNRVMTAPVERPAGKDFLHRPSLQGAIAFDRVSFAYPHTDRKVLDNVSFTINPGEKVGIIGRIGSGKSTIARLIMGLYEPSGGTILVDSTDYRQIDPADLRRNMTCISQDVTLLRGTVRENITISCPDATEEEILAASTAAGAHAFISSHPMGYDAPVGERGDGLSGGQKQCIALARALLHKPKVMICDEPTNAMDVQTEEHFVRMIHEQSKDQTLILITHRTSLMPLVDRLILIDGGRVLADGPRDQVIAALARNSKAGGSQ
ncbi:MAG TPA: type I secretion system permease/ATPase [Alphaproteobacteria bacterium]|nr:type I secretion system permease/ATPase [Alphaproteobacteria bacterium]